MYFKGGLLQKKMALVIEPFPLSSLYFIPTPISLLQFYFLPLLTSLLL